MVDHDQNEPTMIPATEILVPAFFFATLFGIIYIIFTTRHRERMNMIEKGMDPNASKHAPDPGKSLRNGLLFVGVGIGLLAGWFFEDRIMEGSTPMPYFVGAAIFGGLAQIIYYIKFARKQPE